MGTFLAVLVVFVLLPLAAAFGAADSRPLDVERPTRWWPARRT